MLGHTKFRQLSQQAIIEDQRRVRWISKPSLADAPPILVFVFQLFPPPFFPDRGYHGLPGTSFPHRTATMNPNSFTRFPDTAPARLPCSQVLPSGHRRGRLRWAAPFLRWLLSPTWPARRATRSRRSVPGAYELLLPFEAPPRDDAAFNVLLGEAALKTNRADTGAGAVRAQPGRRARSVEAHLGLGRAYLALGNYARAKIEFETVLRFDDLPPDLESQVEIYAEAARRYAEGRRLLSQRLRHASATATTASAPRGRRAAATTTSSRTRRRRPELRAGRRLRARSAAWTTASATTTPPTGATTPTCAGTAPSAATSARATGSPALRGRVSYRGDGNYRNDFGVYGNYRLRLDADNQVAAGAGSAPAPLPERPAARAHAQHRRAHRQLDAFAARRQGQLHARWPGRARVQHRARRRRRQLLRPVAVVSFSITENLGGFAFVWWQNDRYNIERLGAPGDSLVGIGTRNDNLYEVGGGLTWQFAPELVAEPGDSVHPRPEQHPGGQLQLD